MLWWAVKRTVISDRRADRVEQELDVVDSSACMGRRHVVGYLKFFADLDTPCARIVVAEGSELDGERLTATSKVKG
jgi:hypothetical protein